MTIRILIADDQPEVRAGMGMLMGADKSEHYELSAYRNLNNFARSLGETEVADLLAETLAEEEAADKKARELLRSLGTEAKAAS